MTKDYPLVVGLARYVGTLEYQDSQVFLRSKSPRDSRYPDVVYVAYARVAHVSPFVLATLVQRFGVTLLGR